METALLEIDGKRYRRSFDSGGEAPPPLRMTSRTHPRLTADC